MSQHSARRRRFLRARVAEDAGVAMIMVVGVTTVMTVLVSTALAYAIAVQPQARRDQDWSAALAAAQSGVDDYVARLNKSDSYAKSVDCTNQALKGPKAETNTCGWNSSTAPGWINVQPGVASGGQFHYDVDTSSFFRDGTVRLDSTGRVNGVSRTLQVRVSRGGSTEFLYYTDFEDSDPANTVAYAPSGTTRIQCGSAGASQAKYWWQDNDRGCREITFVGGDVLDGRVHFNDSPWMSPGSGSTRPQFLKGFETADPNCTEVRGKGDSNGNGTASGDGYCWRSTSTINPYVGPAGAVPAAALYLPDNSDAFQNYPGCVYTGDTRIRFNSNGTMDVWNTRSSGTAIKGPDTPGATNCGNASLFVAGADGFSPAGKQTVPVPNDMVIYVKNAAGGSSICRPGQVVNGSASGSASGDVIPLGGTGYTAGSTYMDVTDVNYFNPSTRTRTVVKEYTRSASGWSVTSQTGPTWSQSGDQHQTTFDCGSGNVYIEGTLTGRVTIAAQNNVIVTSNLAINSTPVGDMPVGTDMVGLVAANSVVVYHPVSRSTSAGSETVAKTQLAGASATCPSTSGSASNPSGGSTGSRIRCTYTLVDTAGSTYANMTFPGQTTSSGTRWVYASIQTLQHSFWVQSYDKGNPIGTLAVRGSIAQKWRGAVGTGSGSTGFYKSYSYDARLQFSSPPYFPQWINAAWGAKTTGELRPQYS